MTKQRELTEFIWRHTSDKKKYNKRAIYTLLLLIFLYILNLIHFQMKMKQYLAFSGYSAFVFGCSLQSKPIRLRWKCNNPFGTNGSKRTNGVETCKLIELLYRKPESDDLLVTLSKLDLSPCMSMITGPRCVRFLVAAQKGEFIGWKLIPWCAWSMLTIMLNVAGAVPWKSLPPLSEPAPVSYTHLRAHETA